MRKRKIAEKLRADIAPIQPERIEMRNDPFFSHWAIQGLGPFATITGLPEEFPLMQGMRPGVWRGNFSGLDMAKAWHEGYHAATRHALDLLEGKDDA